MESSFSLISLLLFSKISFPTQFCYSSLYEVSSSTFCISWSYSAFLIFVSVYFFFKAYLRLFYFYYFGKDSDYVICCYLRDSIYSLKSFTLLSASYTSSFNSFTSYLAWSTNVSTYSLLHLIALKASVAASFSSSTV